MLLENQSLLAILLLLPILAHSVSAEALELDAASFHKTIDTNDGSLVMFYAPWCPHCVEAKPKFNNAAKEVTKEPGKVMGMVDCDEKKNQDLCAKEKIEGYPTIKFYSKGKLIQDFEDDNSEKALIEFMKNPPKEGEKRPPSSSTGSEKDDQDSEPDTFMAGVTYLGAGNYSEILNSHEFVLVFYYAPWCPHCKDSKPKFEKAAKDLEAKPVAGNILAAINCDQKDNQKLCEDEKVEGYPTIRLMKKREMWAEFEDEIEAKPLLDFISNPPKEKVPPTPVEEEKKPGDSGKEESAAGGQAEKPEDKMKHVTYLEGSEQFDESIKSNKYVLVMFYAPWCPHCQQAKPAFDKAAEGLVGAQGKVLAAVNCDVKANEKLCEDQKVEGFPTFMLFSDGKKSQDYAEAPITEAGVKTFMEKLPADAAAKDEL
ncbi:hypothetical protein BOX15_Mlig025167g1 [Macrostomum lignano]|uniref:Uncharacterized protein n=2 Tax=Macrostomum lignano TaxID=282301 RepID=A0A267FBG5_9PLAT|nr:hypothetical protein BOX15_Mlig025167g1 [Macrostomum lignano]